MIERQPIQQTNTPVKNAATDEERLFEAAYAHKH